MKRLRQSEPPSLSEEARRKRSRTDRRGNTPWPLSFDEWIRGEPSPTQRRGLFARRNIPAGTRIYVGFPEVVVSPPEGWDRNTNEISYTDEWITPQIERCKRSWGDSILPRDLWLGLAFKEPSQHQNISAEEIDRRRVLMNAFDHYNDVEGQQWLVLLLVSCNNHSCRPNAEFTIDRLFKNRLSAGSGLQGILHARRDVPAGEELLINYLPGEPDLPGGPVPLIREDRLKGLRERWEFDRTCVICSDFRIVDGKELGNNDGRVRRIAEIITDIHRWAARRPVLKRIPVKLKHYVTELLSRSREEDIEGEATVATLEKAALVAARAHARRSSNRQNFRLAANWFAEALEIRSRLSGTDTRPYHDLDDLHDKYVAKAETPIPKKRRRRWKALGNYATSSP